MLATMSLHAFSPWPVALACSLLVFPFLLVLVLRDDCQAPVVHVLVLCSRGLARCRARAVPSMGSVPVLRWLWPWAGVGVVSGWSGLLAATVGGPGPVFTWAFGGFRAVVLPGGFC